MDNDRVPREAYRLVTLHDLSGGSMGIPVYRIVSVEPWKMPTAVDGFDGNAVVWTMPVVAGGQPVENVTRETVAEVVAAVDVVLKGWPS